MQFQICSMKDMSLSTARCYAYTKGQQFEKLPFYLFHNDQDRRRTKFLCSATKGGRGFNPRSKKEKINKVKSPNKESELRAPARKSTSKPPDLIPSQVPWSITQLEGKSENVSTDGQFEERLEAVKRSALQQKKTEKIKQYGAIDYDAPIQSEQKTMGLGTKIGVGVAVVVFGLLFAFGDFLPFISDSSNNEAIVVEDTLTEDEKSALKGTKKSGKLSAMKSKLWFGSAAILGTRLQQYEAALSMSPTDPAALEGAAVTLSELGEYSRAASLLETLSKQKTSDPEVYRLLGEVKYKLKDFEGSAAAFKSSASVTETIDFEVLRGLTNALLAAKKPDEAVQFLLASREHLSAGNSGRNEIQASKSGTSKMEIQKIDPIQVELLLGKAYSDWGHVGDAISIYDQLISMHSNDFHGYLAKGILLKENGKVGDAERMFIQARFFAPENAKAFVDRYAKR